MFPDETNLESLFTFETGATPSPEEPPFQVLLLGDWSGKISESTNSELSNRRPLVIDRDNFDAVMQRLNVGLELDLQGDGKEFLSLQFKELDDFHPDNIFRQIPLFADLRDIRRRLLNPDSFDDAAHEVRSWFPSPPENEPPTIEEPIVLDDAPPVESGNLLDMILTRPGEASSATSRAKSTDNSELGRLISKVVTPFLVKVDEREQSNLVAAVDTTTSELMRQILHHPKFQALESAWRGLHFLVKRLETDVDLKIFILNLSKNELTGSLKTADNLTESAIYNWLVRETIETPGGQPWAVVCGNYSFNPDVDDIAALMRLSKICSAADAPFISYIKPEMFGINSFDDQPSLSSLKFSENSNEGKLWTALRSQPESNYLGFSIMRVLSRLPYGETTDSTETFSFEEFTEQNNHSQFLWTNPCFAVALLLSQSYRLHGWDMGQALRRDIEGLPIYIYRENGDSKTKPCAEVVLTEDLSERILEQGFIPLISFRDTDRVRVGRFQAISLPNKNLEGRWNH